MKVSRQSWVNYASRGTRAILGLIIGIWLILPLAAQSRQKHQLELEPVKGVNSGLDLLDLLLDYHIQRLRARHGGRPRSTHSIEVIGSRPDKMSPVESCELDEVFVEYLRDRDQVLVLGLPDPSRNLPSLKRMKSIAKECMRLPKPSRIKLTVRDNLTLFDLGRRSARLLLLRVEPARPEFYRDLPSRRPR